MKVEAEFRGFIREPDGMYRGIVLVRYNNHFTTREFISPRDFIESLTPDEISRLARYACFKMRMEQEAFLREMGC